MGIFSGIDKRLLLCTALLFLGTGWGEGGSRAQTTASAGTKRGVEQNAGLWNAEVCAAGCAAAQAPQDDLELLEFERLLQSFAREPMSAESEALEALLFHGAAARALLNTPGSELDAQRENFLRRELAHEGAFLDVRFVDDQGVERLRLGESFLPFGEKRHLHPKKATRMQGPQISGTVRRVGLKHLWVRL